MNSIDDIRFKFCPTQISYADLLARFDKSKLPKEMRELPQNCPLTINVLIYDEDDNTIFVGIPKCYGGTTDEVVKKILGRSETGFWIEL